MLITYSYYIYYSYGQFTTEKTYLEECLEALSGMPKRTQRDADDFISRITKQSSLVVETQM